MGIYELPDKEPLKIAILKLFYELKENTGGKLNEIRKIMQEQNENISRDKIYLKRDLRELLKLKYTKTEGKIH